MKYLRLFESFVDVDDLYKILLRDCEPFMDLILNHNRVYTDLLFRGISTIEFNSSVVSEGVFKKKVRKERRPVDTDFDISEYFDDLFERYYNDRLRSSGLFTSKNLDDCKQYGKPYIIFPIGKFNYYWNPDIIDLYGHINYEVWYGAANRTIEDYYEFCDDPRESNDRYIFAMGSLKINDTTIVNFEGDHFFFNDKMMYCSHISKLYDQIIPYIRENYKDFHLVEKDGKYLDSDGNVLIDSDTKYTSEFIEWVPVDEYEFLNTHVEPANEIVSGYIKNSQFDKILRQETIIICDEYYAIDMKYYESLKEIIKSNSIIK